MSAAMQLREQEHLPSNAGDRLSAIIGRETGLRQRPQDLEALRAWIGDRVRILGLTELHEFERILGQNSPVGRAERQLLNERLTTGESYFFRDAGQIDLLAGTILPELIARRAARRRLRIWSAGCSTGEEAYTLAMLLDELGPSLAGWNVQIVASDINLNALEKARRGLYSAWSFRTTDATRRARYFASCGTLWQIDQHLRERVSFRALDLVRDRFPDPEAGLIEFDLILCRNVFIYLNEQAIDTVIAKFASAISEGGYLVTGHSELFAHDTAPLRIRMYPQSAAFQNIAAPEAEPARPAARSTKSLPPARPAPARARQPIVETPKAKTPPPPVPAPTRDVDEIMQRAWRHADGGRRDEAARACADAVHAAPFDARPHFLLAQLAQQRSDTGAAKELLRKALYLDPNFVAACLELAALHTLESDGDASRRMFRTARAVLQRLPATAVIPPYATSTAAEVLAYVDRMLGAVGT